MSESSCAIVECPKPARAKGWCMYHYSIYREGPTCSSPGCDRVVLALNVCNRHYRSASGPAHVCPQCEQTFRGPKTRVFCSRSCQYIAQTDAFHRAVKAGDAAAILREAQAASMVSPSGCWLWKNAINTAGYAVIGQGAKGGLVHRHVLAAATGVYPGRNVVHHQCANRSCVNPDHLQLTTQRENMAEMFERNYYIARIAELEAALAAAHVAVPTIDKEVIVY